MTTAEEIMQREIDRLSEVNAMLLKALKRMEKEFGYGAYHPQGLVHDEHEALRCAMNAIDKAEEQQ